jgi:hypothetical protein
MDFVVTTPAQRLQRFNIQSCAALRDFVFVMNDFRFYNPALAVAPLADGALFEL